MTDRTESPNYLHPSGRTHTRLPDNVCSDLTAPADPLRARLAWGIAKRLQRRAAGPAPEAAITPPQMDRLARMPSHWPSHWPAERPEAPDATPPRRSEPPLHKVLARLAPSVTRATQRRRERQAAQ